MQNTRTSIIHKEQMNLSPLTQSGFNILTDEAAVYASRRIEREDTALEFIVYANGEIELIEYYKTAPEDIIALGEVNSIEQAVYVFQTINAINTTGKHKLQ